MTEPTSQPPDAPADAAPAAPPRPVWMKLLGLRRRPGRLLKLAPTRWGWALILLFVVGAGSAAFAEYSMQPDFCRSCHIMEPYYQAWHTSTHKNVPCTDCHFEPGLKNTFKGKWEASSQAAKFITGTYGSKPHAQINDASCMRSGCHEKRLLEGKVNWTVKSVNGHDVTIRFDHTPHLGEDRRGKQLRCVSCHSQIVQGQHLVVTLDTCFLCHMKGKEHGRNEETVGGCQACHEAPKQEVRLATGVFKHADYLQRGVTCNNCHSDVIKGDGAVPRQVCWTCHNQPAQVGRYGDTAFLHRSHISEHKTECSSCHIQIQHSLNAVAKLADAHQSQDPTTCDPCHTQTHGGPAELYRGTGGRGVLDMPSPMFRAQVDCIACHKNRKSSDADATVVGQTFLAVQDSCNYCHGNKYPGTLETWKNAVAVRLNEADEAYTAAKQALEARGSVVSATLRLKAERLMSDAEHNIRLVRLGHGVHNVNYATALLSVAIERSREAEKVLRGSGPDSLAMREGGGGP